MKIIINCSKINIIFCIENPSGEIVSGKKCTIIAFEVIKVVLEAHALDK